MKKNIFRRIGTAVLGKIYALFQRATAKDGETYASGRITIGKGVSCTISGICNAVVVGRATVKKGALATVEDGGLAYIEDGGRATVEPGGTAIIMRAEPGSIVNGKVTE